MTSTNTYTHSNYYLSLVCNIALDNKYTRWYFNIISRALDRPRNRKDAKALLGYIEGHHILPKSFNLEGQKDKNNIVYLTAREHFIIHAILFRMFVGVFKHKMLYAFNIIKVGNQHSVGNRYFNSKLYSYHKKYFADIFAKDRDHLEKMWAASSAVRKGKEICPEVKRRISNTLKGHIVTEETRRKLSASNKGKKRSQDQKRHLSKIRTGMKCKPCSEERKRHLSKIRTGKKHKPQALQKLRDYHKNKWAKAPLLSCPHCKATYKSKSILTRLHNDNCKQKPL
jgi:hypothetical protein